MDVALRKVKVNIDRLFDKNLNDLVRGIRSNKDAEAKYINMCIDEIKDELRQDNMTVKANGILKLTYLQMLGYDISWASFNVVEVMSSSRFTHKRIGYLAASQSFHADTEVLMLTTNMVRKDVTSASQYDAGVALASLACFVSSDVARDLANDTLTLLSSTKPYLRKRATLLLYKIFLKYPEALRPAFPRLKEKLEDPDPGVQCAVVNVICELARKNPRNYLGLAPVFFKLMTTSTNNWLLIKIIKLFGALTPLEPRLGKKLIEPLTNLIHSTSAMSLLYECINTVIAVLISISSGMPTHTAAIQLCVQKLRILIEDSDQNLKYLGLLAMGRILLTHPKSVTVQKDLIMRCLDDRDESIRLRALDLLHGMVTKKSLMQIVKRLMEHMARAEGAAYRDYILARLVAICSRNNYQFVASFEWYVSVLVELCRVQGSQHGPLVSDQMMDVAVRVPTVRRFAVSQMALLLQNASLLLVGTHANSMLEVLYAAAWICGEFGAHLTDTVSVIDALLSLHTAPVSNFIQAVCVHSALKLYTRLCSLAAPAAAAAPAANGPPAAADNADSADNDQPATDNGHPSTDADNADQVATAADNADQVATAADNADQPADNADDDQPADNAELELTAADSMETVERVAPVEAADNADQTGADNGAVNSNLDQHRVNAEKARELLASRLPLFADSADVEVQERAVSALQLLRTVQRLQQRGHDATGELDSLFAGQLGPVAARAQKKVPLPPDLDLDTPIYDQSDSDASEEYCEEAAGGGRGAGAGGGRGYGLGNDVFVRCDVLSSGGAAVGGSQAYQQRREPTAEELQQAREQRINQQQQNPHYLGSVSSPTTADCQLDQQQQQQQPRQQQQQYDEQLSPPPIKPLGISVPLRIEGLASSDAYLLEASSRVSRKGKKKRSKHRGGHADDLDGRASVSAAAAAEEEVHHAVLAGGEMPDGARASSQEEEEEYGRGAHTRPDDDPHRALNIDLDSPLAAGEVLPVPTHRVTSHSATPAPSVAAKHQTKSARSRADKHKRADKSRSKHALKQSSSAADAEHGAAGAGGDAEFTMVATTATTGDTRSGDAAAAAAQMTATQQRRGEATEPTTVHNGDKADKAHKRRRDKRDKKRRSKNDGAAGGGGDGVATTSVSLLSNDSLSLVYVCQPLGSADASTTVQLVFTVTHRAGATAAPAAAAPPLRDVQLQLSLPPQVALQSQDGVQHKTVSLPVCASLPAGEHVTRHAELVISDLNISSHLIGGRLGSRHQQSGETVWLEFPVQLQCVQLLAAPWQQPDQQLFEQLLVSGTLTAGANCVIRHVHTSFDTLLSWLSVAGRMCVVHRVDTTASMYGRSLAGHHLCILVKQLPLKQFGIDGKSDCQPLLDSVVANLSSIVKQHAKQ